MNQTVVLSITINNFNVEILFCPENKDLKFKLLINNEFICYASSKQAAIEFYENFLKNKKKKIKFN